MAEDTLLKILRRGDIVEAIDIPKDVIDVAPGTLGVVFEEAEYHEKGTGPMVRFITPYVTHTLQGTPCCNVYKGWVRLVRP